MTSRVKGDFDEAERFFWRSGNGNLPETYFSVLIVFFYKFGFGDNITAAWLGKKDDPGI